MTIFIALLRAVNVGGTGKLPMNELKAMCVAEGYTRVEPYGASGNVVFAANATAAAVRRALEARLRAYAGKPVGVVVRTGAEMQAALDANPFPDADPPRVVTFFLNGAPPPDLLGGLRGLTNEEVSLGKREIYVHYPTGQGKSKLVIPESRVGTARNMNTVSRLAELARAH